MKELGAHIFAEMFVEVNCPSCRDVLRSRVNVNF